MNEKGETECLEGCVFWLSLTACVFIIAIFAYSFGKCAVERPKDWFPYCIVHIENNPEGE